MSNSIQYAGYQAKIEYDSETGLLIGTVQGLSDALMFECETAAEVHQRFKELIDDYLDMCERYGKTPEKAYKGSFNVRIPPELHRKAALKAQSQEESLNQFVENAIYAKVYPQKEEKPHIETYLYMQQFVSSGSRSSFEIVNSIPRKEIQYKQ